MSTKLEISSSRLKRRWHQPIHMDAPHLGSGLNRPSAEADIDPTYLCLLSWFQRDFFISFLRNGRSIGQIYEACLGSHSNGGFLTRPPESNFVWLFSSWWLWCNVFCFHSCSEFVDKFQVFSDSSPKIFIKEQSFEDSSIFFFCAETIFSEIASLRLFHFVVVLLTDSHMVISAIP